MTSPDAQKYNIFRMLRIIRDKKAKELADELGITPAYINAIEKGDRFPSDRLLRDYAHALGVNEELLLTFKPEAHKHQPFETVLLSLLQMISNLDS